MKKYIILLLVCSLGCKTKVSNEIYGNWHINHIYYDNEEITDNNYDENGWNVPGYKTKLFNILKQQNTLNIYMDREQKPLTGNFKILEDTSKVQFLNFTDKRFNGVYSKKIDTDTIINNEGLEIVYYYMILESDKTAILALKNKVLDPK